MDKNKKTNGALIGSIIVILILVIGGFYMWTSSIEQNQANREKTIEQIKAAIIEADNALKGVEEGIGINEVVDVDFETIIQGLE